MAHCIGDPEKLEYMSADVFAHAKRSSVMSAIRARDTKPEMIVRRWLHGNGYRYVLHDRRLPGVPDVVLPRFHTAIQVRGCFWHKHHCPDGHMPKSREKYWVPKLNNNAKRDKRNGRRLRQLGWRLIVVWECEVSTGRRATERLPLLLKQLHAGGQ
jgi:DNA mismatch endonuclease (patch repair protein)